MRLTLIAAGAASAAYLVVRGDCGLVARRLPGDLISTDHERRPTGRLARLVVTACVGFAVLVAVVGVLGAVVGAVVIAALIASRLRRASSHSLDCALTIDLIAGCLAAGAPLPQAISAAAVAAPDVLAPQLTSVARALAAGAPPVEAWSIVVSSSASMAAMARVCTRGIGSGAAIAAELNGIAARERRRRRTARQQRINRASIWAVLPLGLCFLPAFVLIGVVPLVVGLFPKMQ